MVRYTLVFLMVFCGLAAADALARSRPALSTGLILAAAFVGLVALLVLCARPPRWPPW